MLVRSMAEADLEIREDAGGDGWTVRGIAVPWGVPAVIDRTLTEEFLPGAFDAQIPHASRVLLANGHLPMGGKLVGRLGLMRNDGKGLYVEGRISATRDGQDTRTLVADKVLDRMSIGFKEGRNRRAGQVLQRVTADLREVAIVPNPAYADAVIDGLRHALQAACPDCLARAAAEDPEPEPEVAPVRARALEAERLMARIKPLDLRS